MTGGQARSMGGAALLTVVLLAGCGRADSRTSPATGTPATTLHGTIIDTDRPSCRVLQTSTARWSLAGPGVDDLRIGDTVTVTGSPQSHPLGLCGRSFLVTSLRRS